MTPDEHTLSESFLDVGDGHSLYLQEWGNRKGLPVIFIHGGPGSSCSDKHKLIFNPAKHYVVFFDQRGSGRSLPFGSLKNNTTDDLVDDIEKIANHLKLRHFVITGGSWGACLALAYSLKHPERVRSLILSGIFTGSQSEIDYFSDGVFRYYFPDIWANYLNTVPKKFQHNPSAYHFEQALNGSGEAAKKSAYIFSNLEHSLLNLDERVTPGAYEDFDPSSTRIEMHYMLNRCFMTDRYILDRAKKLTMPIWLVQGRYDMVCPGKTAYELDSLLPNSELIWTLSGHRNERESWNVIRSLLLTAKL